MHLDAGAAGYPRLRVELFDVRLVDAVRRKVGRPGAAAAAARQAKVRKYGPYVRAAGHRFIALCGDLYGRVVVTSKKR